MVAVPVETINKIRRILFTYDGHVRKYVYRKPYRGEKNVPHVNIEYTENGRDKILQVPKGAVKVAKEKGAFRRFEAIKSVEPVTYNKKPARRWQYEGGYTTEEIRQHVQEISNRFKDQGKKGKITVAVRNWAGNGAGVWRSGTIGRFGDNVKFLADYDGLVLEHEGFAIYIFDE